MSRWFSIDSSVGLVRQDDPFDEAARGLGLVALHVDDHVLGGDGQTVVHEAADGAHVDVAVGGVVLDVGRVREQDQLSPDAARGSSAGEFLYVLSIEGKSDYR